MLDYKDILSLIYDIEFWASHLNRNAQNEKNRTTKVERVMNGTWIILGCTHKLKRELKSEITAKDLAIKEAFKELNRREFEEINRGENTSEDEEEET